MTLISQHWSHVTVHLTLPTLPHLSTTMRQEKIFFLSQFKVMVCKGKIQRTKILFLSHCRPIKTYPISLSLFRNVDTQTKILSRKCFDASGFSANRPLSTRSIKANPSLEGG